MLPLAPFSLLAFPHFRLDFTPHTFTSCPAPRRGNAAYERTERGRAFGDRETAPALDLAVRHLHVACHGGVPPHHGARARRALGTSPAPHARAAVSPYPRLRVQQQVRVPNPVRPHVCRRAGVGGPRRGDDDARRLSQASPCEPRRRGPITGPAAQACAGRVRRRLPAGPCAHGAGRAEGVQAVFEGPETDHPRYSRQPRVLHSSGGLDGDDRRRASSRPGVAPRRRCGRCWQHSAPHHPDGQGSPTRRRGPSPPRLGGSVACKQAGPALGSQPARQGVLHTSRPAVPPARCPRREDADASVRAACPLHADG
ncbi:hypothetical protein, conserved [Leishmania tarentolae]|uniref:Uncharacterized protein n=1 Tax=Leishmania tarentolae TaxID=5689 RepID=A0A640KM73_LEITA|nr:hypothetical protein, conserved [Leishmania tarentolae]GET88551.1 hypothetical protein, conserved [Leishmania tarentolae]